MVLLSQIKNCGIKVDSIKTDLKYSSDDQSELNNVALVFILRFLLEEHVAFIILRLPPPCLLLCWCLFD